MLSCLVMSDSLRPHGLYSPWNFPGQDTEVGSLSLLRGIFPTRGSNPGLPYCRWILNCLSHQGIPIILLRCDICSEFSMLIFHIRTCFSNYKLFSKSFNLSFTKTVMQAGSCYHAFLFFFSLFANEETET